MGCTIKSNRLSGVFVRDGGNAVLRDNTLTDNGEYGVSLMVRRRGPGGCLGGAPGDRRAVAAACGSDRHPRGGRLSTKPAAQERPARPALGAARSRPRRSLVGPAPPQDGATARLFDNKVAGNGTGSVQVDVGSVAVNVEEVNGKNSLDTPATAIRL